MTQVKGVKVTIRGRVFVQESPTFEQEMYIMQLVRESGLDGVSLTLDPSGDDLEPKVKDVIIQAYKADILFKLMASLVVEEGTAWTKESCAEVARLFATAQDAEDKKQLQPLLVGGLLAFFASSDNSGATFLPSSMEDDEQETSEISVRRKTKPVLSPEAAAEVMRTGTMKPSSAKSLSSSRSNPTKSSNGRSARASLRTKGS